MKRYSALFVLLLCGMLLWLTGVLAQSNPTAEALNQANLRAEPNVDAQQVGAIQAGTAYPVIGRSELYPWLLLGNPATLQPMGWVFSNLVTVTGNLNTVPLSTLVVNPAAVATPTLAVLNTMPALNATPAPNSTPNAVVTVAATSTGITGTVKGEVNIRYGPGQDYPRVGVAVPGSSYELTAYHTQFPWVQIYYPDAPQQRAWIARDLIEINGDLFSLPPIASTTFNLPTLTPTPSVVGISSRPLNAPSVPLSPQFAELGNQVWRTLVSAGFDLETSRFGALFVMDLQTKEAFSFGGDIAFSGTSVNKISILTRLYETLGAPPDAQLATDIANTMICSENTATNRLLNTIGNGDEWTGAEEVTRFYLQLGLNRSFLMSPYVTDPTKPLLPPRPMPIPITEADQRKANPDISNQITVEDMGWLLDNIYECAYEDSGAFITQFPGQFEPRECRQMLHVMSNNTVDALLKAGVPAETRVAHKHGWIPDTHSNAAVFFTPGGNYVIVVAMFQPQWLSFDESLPVMAEVSRQIYNYYNPTALMPAIREGYIPTTAECNFANTPLITDLRQPIWDQ